MAADGALLVRDASGVLQSITSAEGRRRRHSTRTPPELEHHAALDFVLLLLANAAYYAWSHGQLATWGLAPTPSNEPERVRQQLHPEDVRVLALTAPAPAPAAPPAPC